MSTRTAVALTANLRESTIEVLWRQWRAIGGAAAGAPITTQVDLESLCLASLVLEEYEPRLWTTLTDWVALGSALVSLQRMRNLSASFPNGAAHAQRFAQAAIDVASDARWRPLAASGKKRVSRNLGVARRRSAGPTLLEPPALMLRMRSAFGVGLKADLIAFLLGQKIRVSVSEAASALQYTIPSVFRALQDLYAAGLIRVAELPAAAEYWADSAQWCTLLGGSQKIVHWGYWRELITYSCAVIHWDAETRGRALGEYARGALLRDLAETHQADLLRAGVLDRQAVLPQSPDVTEWRAFHKHLSEYMDRKTD